MSIQKAVKKGAELLDKVYPKWYNKISLDELCMSRGCQCILGQLYSSYRAGIGELDLVLREWDYGFDLKFPVSTPIKDFSHLQEEWTKVIKERRENHD